jgi:ubiquinone biosynthesis UbiH/UbiF/VisC/COQ6 family hydroxylase
LTPQYAEANPTRTDVQVHGRGPVALTLALLLARAGRRVSLPSVPVTSPAALATSMDIRAYALNAASKAVLSDLKVWQALPPAAVCAVQDMRVFGDAPGSGVHFSAYESRVEALAHIVDAAALTAALQQAVDFTPGVMVRPPVAPSPTAGAACDAPLQVWADGRRGADNGTWLRQRGLSPLDDEQREGYGHVALAARLLGPQHRGTAWQWFGGNAHQQDVLALLPTGAPDAWGLVWSMPQARAQTLLALDDDAFTQALNADLSERTRAHAAQLAPGGWRLNSARQAWPLAQARLQRWVGPGWAVAGDAAHVVHPLAGQGLNLGLADAACLARVLNDPSQAWRPLGDPRRLACYERERLAEVATMQVAVDGLWQIFAMPGTLAQGGRRLGLGLFERAGPLKRWVAAQAFG